MYKYELSVLQMNMYILLKMRYSDRIRLEEIPVMPYNQITAIGLMLDENNGLLLCAHHDALFD